MGFSLHPHINVSDLVVRIGKRKKAPFIVGFPFLHLLDATHRAEHLLWCLVVLIIQEFFLHGRQRCLISMHESEFYRLACAPIRGFDKLKHHGFTLFSILQIITWCGECDGIELVHVLCFQSAETLPRARWVIESDLKWESWSKIDFNKKILSTMSFLATLSQRMMIFLPPSAGASVSDISMI